MSAEQPSRPSKGIDQKPPEQPQSFKVDISTYNIDDFAKLPPDMQRLIPAFFEGPLYQMLASPELADEKDSGGIRLMSYLSFIRYGISDVQKVGEGRHHTSAIVTTVLDEGENALAGISIMLFTDGKLDTEHMPQSLIARGRDPRYGGVIAPLALAVRHRALLALNPPMESYKTVVWKGTLDLYDRLNIPYKIIPDPNLLDSQSYVEVSVKPEHTKQLFEQLHLDYAVDPFTAHYPAEVTPLPPRAIS